MCKRWTGGLLLCFEAEASAVTVQGEVTRYRSSAFAERAFCPRRGSHLWFTDLEEGGQPSRYELMPGLFDAARNWPLRSEIYVDRAMASALLQGGHRRKTRAEYEADNPFVEGDLARGCTDQLRTLRPAAPVRTGASACIAASAVGRRLWGYSR